MDPKDNISSSEIEHKTIDFNRVNFNQMTVIEVTHLCLNVTNVIWDHFTQYYINKNSKHGKTLQKRIEVVTSKFPVLQQVVLDDAVFSKNLHPNVGMEDLSIEINTSTENGTVTEMKQIKFVSRDLILINPVYLLKVLTTLLREGIFYLKQETLNWEWIPAIEDNLQELLAAIGDIKQLTLNQLCNQNFKEFNRQQFMQFSNQKLDDFNSTLRGGLVISIIYSGHKDWNSKHIPKLCSKPENKVQSTSTGKSQFGTKKSAKLTADDFKINK